MPTSSAVPTTMPRPKMRWGSTVSPAENVTYCHPSYAHSTPIMPVTAPLSVDIDTRSGHQTFWCVPLELIAISASASSTITPALSAVATPCTSALRRVPRTFSTVTATIINTATPFAAAGDNGTNTLTYLGNAAPSVASDPLPMTRNIVQP